MLRSFLATAAEPLTNPKAIAVSINSSAEGTFPSNAFPTVTIVPSSAAVTAAPLATLFGMAAAPTALPTAPVAAPVIHDFAVSIATPEKRSQKSVKSRTSPFSYLSINTFRIAVGSANAPAMPVICPPPARYPPIIAGTSPAKEATFAAIRDDRGVSSVTTNSGAWPRATSPDTDICNPASIASVNDVIGLGGAFPSGLGVVAAVWFSFNSALMGASSKGGLP